MKGGKDTAHIRFIFEQVYPGLVQSSVKLTNHLYSEILGIVDGPKMSLCTKKKGDDDLLLLIGKGTRVCFAYSQISQWKDWTSKPLNKVGNIIFNAEKGTWPRHTWCSQITSVLEEENNENKADLLNSGWLGVFR